jgi:CheY-like chemotaxis protein
VSVAHATKTRTVLVVEDDPDLRESLAALLEDEGFVAARAIHGQDAIEWLAEAGPEGLPCAILLDLMMPVMNGWQFLEWIRKQPPPTGSTPVIVLSAGRNRESVENLGFSEFLTKPIDLGSLLDAVERHCRAP